VVAEVGEGLSGGDQIEVAVVDLDTAATYASVTQPVVGVGASKLTDSSGNGLDGTVNGTVAAVAGEFGNALSFPGGSSAAMVTLPAGLQVINGATPWTMECWAQRAGTQPANGGNILGDWQSNATLDNICMMLAANNQVGAGVFDSSGNAHWLGLSNSFLDTDALWHHWALSYDGTTVRFFFGGVLVGSWAGTLRAKTSTPFVIGNAYTGADSFNGAIDEVRFSNVARYTAAFTPPSAAFTADANTLALYHSDSIAISANTVAKVATPWTYAPPTPANAGLEIANLTAARGELLSAALEVRYA
jgi:hypothetical protein